MKTGIFVALAFIALVNGEIEEIHEQSHHETELRDVQHYKRLLRIRSTSDIQICVPGSTKKEDCNNCFCNAIGSGWACTKMGCDDSIIINIDGSIDQPDETKLKQRVKRGLVIPFACSGTNERFSMEKCWSCTCNSYDEDARCVKIC